VGNPWFRLYAEFAADPVIQSLAFEDQRHFVVLLCLKCQGILDRNIAKPARERIILRGLGLDAVAGNEAKRRLAEVGLIGNDWQISKWDERQYISDTSTQRVRKHRKTKEKGNVSETELKQVCNGPDTDTETDPPKAPKGADVSRVFDHWREAMNHPGAKLGERGKKIRTRLADYTADQLCQAIDGCKASAFHMGENERGTVYDGIALIFKSNEQIEKFMQMAQTPQRAGPSRQPFGVYG
jgi:hypothetical protein